MIALGCTTALLHLSHHAVTSATLTFSAAFVAFTLMTPCCSAPQNTHRKIANCFLCLLDIESGFKTNGNGSDVLADVRRKHKGQAG